MGNLVDEILSRSGERRVAIGNRGEGIGKLPPGGIRQNAVGQPVPVGLAAQQTHALLPGGTIQELLADRERHLLAGLAGQGLQKLLDFFAQLEIPGHLVIGANRLHHPQGQAPAGIQFKAGHGFVGLFGLHHGEAVVAATGLAGVVHPQQGIAIGGVIRKIDQAVFSPQRFKHRLPVGQQAVCIALDQGLLYPMVRRYGLGRCCQASGLIGYGRLQAGSQSGMTVMDGGVKVGAMLPPQQNPGAGDQQCNHCRQPGQQAAEHRLGRGGHAAGRDKEGDQGNQQRQHQSGRQGCLGGHIPLPRPGVHIHAEQGDDLAAALVGAGTDDQVVHPFHISGLGHEFAVDRVFVVVINPATAFGQRYFLNFTAKQLAARPVRLIDQIASHQFRLHRVGQHGHLLVIDKGIQTAPVENAPGRADLRQQTSPAIGMVKFDSLPDQFLGIGGGDIAGLHRWSILDRNQRRDPGSPAVGFRPLDLGGSRCPGPDHRFGGVVVGLTGR